MRTSKNPRRLTLDARIIRAVEEILVSGERAELMPTKDGVKVAEIRRRTVYKTPATLDKDGADGI